MSNERKGGNGDGHGGGGDDVDDFGAPDEPTVVIVSDRFARESIRRLVGVLRSAADRCERLGELGDEAAPRSQAALIVEEIADEMAEVVVIAGGSERALRRHRVTILRGA